jgi:hemolysin activation/secretion protein
MIFLRQKRIWGIPTIVLIACLCGSGYAAAQTAQPVLLEVKRFVVEGDNPLSAQETDAILAPHLGAHRSIETIEAAARALEKEIRDRGFAFHRVIVPAQRPERGDLRLQVLSFRLDDIHVTGNQHFSSENILRSIPALESGRTPNVMELGRQVGLANEHPSKRIAINIKEGKKRDHLDADVRVVDVPSSQTFLALTGHTRDTNNAVNQNTGYTRLTIGYQESNLFDRDHVLTLAYTTSPEYVNRVTQLGAFYWMPFYGYNTSLNAYWTKSDVDTGTIGTTGGSFDVSGRGEFYGVRVTYTLPRFGNVNHTASLSLDSRYFESTVGFTGTPLPTTAVGSLPVSLRYAGRNDQLWGGVGGYVEYVVNTSGGRSNSAADYSTARAGAERHWDAWRWGLDANYPLPKKWALVGRYRAQYADEPLIPGEQFGIGGAASVRGLRERETAGDRGYTLNFEARAPAVGPGLQPFVFYDYGSRTHVTQISGFPLRDSASSLGAGLRWSWQRQLEVAVTYAHVLNGTFGESSNGHDKLLFSAFYRF